MKSIEELALKVAKEMYPDWHHDVTSRLLPAYATRLLELCALLEKAEAAMNSPSGRKYVEALAAIKQWKEKT